jgi:hypothetical protein
VKAIKKAIDHVLCPHPLPSRLMVGRKFLTWLKKSRKGDDRGTTDSPVPPRPQSQLGFRSPEYAAPTLERRESDGKQASRSIRFLSLLTFGATAGTTPEISSISGDDLSVSDVSDHFLFPNCSDHHLPIPYDHHLVSSVSGHHLPVPNVSDHRPPAPNVDQNKPAKYLRYMVDPTAAYKKSNWKSTLHASAGVAIDILKESSDAFTPLKSVVGGLSAILKHYDVRYACSVKPNTSLTFGPASDGEP